MGAGNDILEHVPVFDGLTFLDREFHVTPPLVDTYTLTHVRCATIFWPTQLPVAYVLDSKSLIPNP